MSNNSYKDEDLKSFMISVGVITAIAIAGIIALFVN